MEAGPIGTNLLRALAALLIANSHLETFYPIRQLAADGLLGNSLFFLLSGLGLALSARDPSRIRPFGAWYARRLWRIYPAVFLVVGVGTVLLEGTWRTWSIREAVAALIWPTSYYFIAQITIFYLFFYILMRWGRPALYRIGWMGLIPVYGTFFVLGFDIHWLSWVFYAQMMLLGGDLAVTPRPGRPVRSLVVLGAALPVYVGIKAILSTGRWPALGFLPHALMFPMVVSLVELADWPRLQEAVSSRRWLTLGVDFLASLTLEIYLVHDYVLKAPRVSGLAFPVNLLAFWPISLALAWVVGRVCTRMSTGGPGLGRSRAKLTLS